MQSKIQGDSEQNSRKSGSNYQQLPYTEAHNEAGDAKAAKKKKLLVGGGIGLLALVAIILIIVFATNKKENDGGDDPGPGPGPGPTPVPDGFNPYYSNATEEATSVDSQGGVLIFNASYPTLEEYTAKKQGKSNLKEDTVAGIETKNVASSRGLNNNFLNRVRYKFGQSSYKRTVLSLTDDLDEERFDIPEDLVSKQKPEYQYRLDFVDFKFARDPFSFSFASTRTGEKLIDTTGEAFVFQNKFIQLDMKIPSGHIYGFGERETSFELGQGAWTMWPQQPDLASFDNGFGGKQLGGMHPFVLIKASQSEEFFGIYFRSSNAQAPIISKRGDQYVLSYITTGGNLDVNFFFRGTAKDIIAEYQNFIGLPKLPPFWAMGWHVASGNFTNVDNVKDVVNKYTTMGIPLESIWLDGSYMENHETFTVNKNFTDLYNYTEELHNVNKKVVIQLYGGLTYDYQQPSKFVVEASEALLKTNTGKIFEAETLSNSSVFLDWFQDQANTVWGDAIFDFYDNYAKFDGLWLDMNTPLIFCEGGRPNCDLMKSQRRNLQAEEVSSVDWYTSYGSDYMTENSTYYLPFIPQKNNLDWYTISLNVTHNATKNITEKNITYDQYDVHSLYGLMQSKVTHEILSNITHRGELNPLYDFRKLITSTGTYSGSGQYAQHNLAQMTRSWEHMRYSIAQIMNFNMFGIPFTGADVCGNKQDGVIEDFDEEYELCARWYQLSTFYPLARSYRDIDDGGILTEPYDLPANKSYNMMAQYSILDRYQYARFVYGCLFESSTLGRTCFDPLLFHYPSLDGAYKDIESTFIVGDSVKVSPVLEKLGDQKEYKVFFPKGNWLDLDGYDVVKVTDPEGEMVTLESQLTVKKHLKPGTIVPLQYNITDGKKTYPTYIDQLEMTHINLIVNRDDQGYAEGKLFIDEGLKISELEQKVYEHYQFKIVKNTIQKLVLNTDYEATGRQNLESVVIGNAEDLADAESACMLSNTGIKSTPLAKPVYDMNTKTLTIMAENGGEISLYDMQSIVVRSPKDPYTLCDLQSAGWHIDTATYNAADLERDNAWINVVSDKYPDLNMTIKLTLGGVENRIVNVKIVPDLLMGNDIFEVPEEIVDVQNAVAECNGVNCELSKFVKINLSPEPDFLIRVQNGEEINPVTLWQLNSFIQDDYINTIDAQIFLSSGENFKGIMGLAERTSNELFLGDGVYSLWSRDEPNPVEFGRLPASNNYGVHPFYMAQASDNTWFGVYTNLAHAQDWWIKNDPTTGITNITTVATGGIADISFVFADTPDELTREYHDIVGYPVLTPMWALGWHQCKWGYKSTQELMDVKKNYEFYNLPLDTIWSDIDYMDAYKDFTYDPVDYADLPQFVDDIHKEDYQYIPILDAGIAQREGQDYQPYESGKELNVFIKAWEGGPDFTGEVWPVDAVYPNFFHGKTTEWWHQNLDEFYRKIKFDGLWQDMNEASNFCNGACYSDQMYGTPTRHKIPYTPTGRNLETKSMPLDAYHPSDPLDKNITELDAHSLFGTMQVKASHEWFKVNDRRTMIIERSSFAGLGKFGSRWLGDNFASYDYMGYSVTGVMMHNVIGIPLAGADICGFIGDTTPELCVRWYTVGAFYPFSRNHNNLNQIPQEPYQFHNYTMAGQPYTDMIRKAMQTKLALVPYYYTGLTELSKRGGSFYKPLFFEFPNDPNAYKNLTHNVMLGSGMKASFQSTEDVNITSYYFPDGIWCSIIDPRYGCIDGPRTVEMPSMIFQYYAHIRDGYILPLHVDVIGRLKTWRKVAEIQQEPIELHINTKLGLDMECHASGYFINDDGKVFDTVGYQNAYQFDFSAPCGIDRAAANGPISLNISVLANASNLTPQNATVNDFLGKIVIYNTNSSELEMVGNYDLTVNYLDTTKQPMKLQKQAMFDAMTNRTIYQGWDDEPGEVDKYQLPLWEISWIEFTPAA